MTVQVQTRNFRSPEIILTTSQYDCKVDMWSVGCILGQLINATPQYKGFKQAKDFQQCLFDGDSCYPISPCNNPEDEKAHSSSEEDVNQFSFND